MAQLKWLCVMLIKLIRLIFGSVRFFLTILMITIGTLIVINDVWFDIVVDDYVYFFISTMMAQVMVYQVVESKYKSEPEIMPFLKNGFKVLKDSLEKLFKR